MRQAISQEAAVEVPIAVDLHGPCSYRDRPSVAIFDGHGDVADPRRETFYENIGRLIQAGPKRAAVHVGRSVLDRLEKTADANNTRDTR